MHTKQDKVKEGLDTGITNPVEKLKEDLSDLSGPIKRQM